MHVRPGHLGLLVLLMAALGLLLGAGAAVASPAVGPQFEPQIPLDGAAVQASEEPIKAAFTCPSFVYEAATVEVEFEEVEVEVEEPEEEGETETVLVEVRTPVAAVDGGAEEYGVHFSTSPAVDATGKLGTTGFGEAGEGEVEAIKGSKDQCATELELPSKPVPAALYSGRIYWQAYRASEVPGDKVEVGPVHSFVVYPHVEEPELAFREQAFVGYLTRVGFFYESELGGAVVQLQELEGESWKTVAEAPGSNRGENYFFVKPTRAGHHLFRVYVPTSNPGLGLEPTVKVVRPLTKARVTGSGDDGPYVAANQKESEESPVLFSVLDGGRLLRNLTLEVETVCKGATKAQNVTIEIPAHLEHARIAPDGTVFGVTKTKGAEAWTITLTGSLFQGRFQGELETSHANCQGYRTIDAITKPST